LGLNYELAENLRTVAESELQFSTVVESRSHGSTLFEKLLFLELWCPEVDDTFLRLMGGALKRCPSLMQLRVTSEQEASEVGWEFMTSFVDLVRQFPHIDIEFWNPW